MEEEQGNRYNPVFLNLDLTGILVDNSLLRGEVLHIAGCLAAFLLSPHAMEGVDMPLSNCDNYKYL